MSGHVEVFVSRKSCKASSKAFQANSVPLALCLVTCQSTICLSLIGSLVSLSPETDLSSLFAHSCLKSLNAIYFYALWLLPPQIQSTHSFTLFLYFSVRASSFYFSSLFFLCPFGECKSLKVALLFVFSPLEGKNDPKTSSRLLIVDRTAVTLKHLPFLHIIPLDSSFLAFWQIPKQWAKQEQQQTL